MELILIHPYDFFTLLNEHTGFPSVELTDIKLLIPAGKRPHMYQLEADVVLFNGKMYAQTTAVPNKNELEE